jgi:DNA-binding response OmpR family regulator
MTTVLIVEDDFLVALDIEQELTAAGFIVGGIAASQTEALELAEKVRPDLAIVDIDLSPGDGRIVAKSLHDKFGTVVLFATAQCDEVRRMRETGAVACLPKPYPASVVPAAMRAARRMAEGDPPTNLPDAMFTLAA